MDNKSLVIQWCGKKLTELYDGVFETDSEVSEMEVNLLYVQIFYLENILKHPELISLYERSRFRFDR